MDFLAVSIFLNIKENGETRRVHLGITATLVGRANGCHIQLVDGMTSSKHLAVKIGKDGKAVVKDLDSTNGTYINDYRIAESYLYLDDEIKIGNVIMWLDPASMSPKEKELHTRDGQKTSITFIKLKEYEQQLDGSQFRNIRPQQEEKLTQTKTQKGEPVINNLSHRAKDIANQKVNIELGVDNIIDMDESTGQTKMIKVEKKEIKKKSGKAKKAPQEEKESFADKIINLFKK